MRDCTEQSGEYRDLLPELAAEGEGSVPLPAADRARLVAHLAACDACRAELELLRAARRGAIAGTPAIDVARIVQALPHPPHVAAPRARRARRSAWSRWAGWPMAAAISTVAVAGLSIAVMRDGSRGGSQGVPATAPTTVPAVPAIRAPEAAAVPQGPSAAQPAPLPAPHPRHSAPVAAPSGGESEMASTGLEVGGSLSALDETQLQALLHDIDDLEAEPVGEPEAAAPALRAAAEGA